MTPFAIWRGLRSGALAAGLMGLALAQAQQMAVAPSASAFLAPGAVTLSTNAGALNRIIIRLRPEATSARASRAQTPNSDPQVQIKALGESRRQRPDARSDIELRYYRSVAPRTHVALTSKRMSRIDLSAYVRQLEQDPQVASAEIDERVLAQQALPNDPEFAPRQWNLQSVGSGAGAANFASAWGVATGAGVIVAVIDGGYRPHADLNPNMLAGYDFISADPDGSFTTANDANGRDSDATDPGDWSAQGDCAPANSSWHGTHVAGIIAAVTNNNAGVAGAAFNARLLPVRVLGVCGGYVSDIAAGMRWAAGLPVPGVPANTQIAKVLNLSLGRQGNCSPTFQDAVTEVRAAGSVVVAASGNDSATAILQPANCSGVIGVTAHTVSGDNASYANIGLGTAISAPGGGNGMLIVGSGLPIYSTSNTGTTTPLLDSIEAKRGTSMATAHVSAAAALMFQVKPAITPDELFSRLLNAARVHPAGTYCASLQTCGAGLLDADAAVASVLADNAPLVSARYAPAGIALRGTTVQLTGSADMGRLGLGIHSVLWTQIGGSAVTLSGATTRTASFVVPASGNSLAFRFEATDLNGRSAHIDLTVLSNNTPPVMAEIGSLVVANGSTLSFMATATDAQGDTVTFEASGLPRGASFDSATGSFVWDKAGPIGNYTIAITPNDGRLNGDTRYVGISVVAPGGGSSGGGGGAFGAVEVGAMALLLAALMARLGWRKAGFCARHGKPDRIVRPTLHGARPCAPVPGRQAQGM
ncbi:MAG: S8 family serine peptidase [Rhodoferax sp.]|nr:S8 family serine peptidase [Rhodoferax sp.]